jgi:subtilisin family serine protease
MSVVPRVLATALLSSVVLSGVAPGASAVQPAPQQEAKPAVQPTVQPGPEPRDRYVVRYAPGTDVAAAAKSLRGKKIKVDREFSKAVRAAVVNLTPAEAASLADSPEVEAVEVDAVMGIDATQYSAPWGLDRIDQRALPLSGSFTTAKAGAGVTAYVVDSGVLASHTEFGGRVIQGWSAVTDGVGTGDCNGHGTHVAGTIAGTTYGVAKASALIPVRVFGCSGSGYTSDVIAGLDWVAGHHVAGVPAVVNMSLGGAASSTVDAALQGVINDGVTAVVAAGNSAADACTASPARFAAALTVAASDSSDRQASFSNTGTCVDLYAPGVSILSASHSSNTSTATMSGTSMAAPHTAGAAALLLSEQPALTPAQVTSALIGATTPGVITGAGTGTPNRLLSTVPPAAAPAPVVVPAAKAPAAPTGVRATAGVGSAAVSWTRGADGGSALTAQTVTVWSGALRVKSVTVSGTATTAAVTALTTGKAYSFTVTATNAVGTSPASVQSNIVTTLAAKAPTAPTGVKATAGSRSASLTWTNGGDGGSTVTGQTITVYSGLQRIGAVTVAGSATAARITGLTAGRSYTFTVASTNAIGTGPASVKSNAITALA